MWLLISVAATAQAADEAGLWIREAVGFGGWPSGAVSDTRLQHRVPLFRSDSIVFQDTYAGVGGRLAVTPAYVDFGPRVSLAPIDVFDIDLQASFVGYWPTQFGPMPFSELEGTLESDRGARDESRSGRSSRSTRGRCSTGASSSPRTSRRRGRTSRTPT